MLQSRLYQMEVTRRAKANAQHTQSLSDVSWGSQIRSYVLQVRRSVLTFLIPILR
jgi:peptide chain release factor 2